MTLEVYIPKYYLWKVMFAGTKFTGRLTTSANIAYDIKPSRLKHVPYGL